MDPSYNNSFGSFQQPVISSGTGGVVLNNPNEQKPKKALIFVLASIIVIAIFGVIMFFVISGMNNSSASFGKYASRYTDLLLNGSEENESSDNVVSLNYQALKESGTANIYSIPRGLPLSEENKNYYAELETMLSGMDGDANKLALNAEDKENVKELVDSSKKLLSLYFVGTALVYTNASRDYYLENRSFEGFLENYGYPMAASQDEMTEDFRLMVEQVYNKTYEYYTAISRAACLEANRINYECLINDANINRIQSEMFGLQKILGSYTDKMLRLIVGYANQINNLAGVVEVENE